MDSNDRAPPDDGSPGIGFTVALIAGSALMFVLSYIPRTLFHWSTGTLKQRNAEAQANLDRWLRVSDDARRELSNADDLRPNAKAVTTSAMPCVRSVSGRGDEDKKVPPL